MLSVRCLSLCLSVCPVNLSVCDVGVLWQTVGWIKMKLGMEVSLSHDHTVLDGDPATPRKKGTAPNFRPMSIVAKRSPISATAEHFICFTRL